MDAKQKSINSNQISQSLGEGHQIENLVERIISYKNSSNGRLYSTINQRYLISLMDKAKINEMEKDFPPKGADIIDFVRLILNSIAHRQDETLYVVMALIDLFKQISEGMNLSPKIQFHHLTSILCEQMQEKNSAQYKIQTMQMPETQKFKIDPSRIRSIDINPPPVYGRYDEDLQRLTKQKVKSDSMHHLNHKVKQGFYSKDMKRVLSLDSLADRINIYNLDCEFDHFVQPKSNGSDQSEKMQGDVLIFSFAWSERQQRIGATLKDFTLCFWDKGDNFKYEKQIAIQNFCSDYQASIWYLEFPNCWVTTDSKNQIYEWDLERECIKRTLSSPRIKHTIFEIVEIPQLKLVAVGSSDRLVTIWDFSKALLVQTIEFYKAGIHSFVYFQSYSALICGGFQNQISIHQINPQYLDVNLLGNLVGHLSMISAINCVEKTPMIISSDDSGTIKIWDIRTLKCIQTVDCGQRTVITKIINVYSEGKLCFLGTRINMIDFDEISTIAKKSLSNEEAFPIKVENSQEHLIVVTRKDMRYIDINTGKIKQIFVGLLGDGEDEITAFKSIEQGRKFILGNNKGELTMHNTETGEVLCKLNSHSNEITNLKIDHLNKLLISGGWDSSIKIQYLDESTNEIKREIVNCCYNKEISIIEISVYHNLIFISSNTENVYIFDYEFAKLISQIDLDKNVEVSAMSVINGLSLLIISTNNGIIQIISFTKKEHVFTARLIGQIDVFHLQDFHSDSNCPKCNFLPPTTANFHKQSSFQVDSKTEPKKGGHTLQAQMTKSFKNSSTLTQSREKDKSQSSQAQLNVLENQSEMQEVKEVPSSHKVLFVNKLLVDCELDENDENPKVLKLHLFCSLNKGDIFLLDLLHFYSQFQNITFSEHCNLRSNYNALRASTENFLKSIDQIKNEKIVFDSSTKLFNEGRQCSDYELHSSIYNKLIFYVKNAHRDTVTSMKLVVLTKTYLMTSSMDCYIKIWDKQTGMLNASRNINHPLPIMWTISTNEASDGKKRIIYALKILDIINRKYHKQLSFPEARSLKVVDFLSQVVKWKETDEDENDLFKEESKDEEVLVMKDEYSPRDLKFEQSKQYYQSELRGPTLKRMEANKRVAQATKVWRKQAEMKEAEIDSRLKDDNYINRNRRQEEREELVTFLNGAYRDRILGQEFSKISEEFSRSTQDLHKRMDIAMYKKRKNERMGSILQAAGQNVSLTSIKTISKGEEQRKRSLPNKRTLVKVHPKEIADNIYSYAEKMNYIDSNGHSIYNNKVRYPIINTRQPINFDDQNSFQIPQNSSFIKNNNNNLSLGGESLIQDLPFSSNQQTNQNILGNFNQNDSIQSNQLSNKQMPSIYMTSIQTSSQNNSSYNIGASFAKRKSVNKVSNHTNPINLSYNNNSTTIPNNNSLANKNNVSTLEESNDKKEKNMITKSQSILQESVAKSQIYPLRNNKLQQLLKSMSMKVHKSQQSFTDNSFTSFLEKRKQINMFSFNQGISLCLEDGSETFQSREKEGEKREEEMLQSNEQTSQSKTSIKNESHDHQSKEKEDKIIKNIQQSIKMQSQKKLLTDAGLETLKLALYGNSSKKRVNIKNNIRMKKESEKTVSFINETIDKNKSQDGTPSKAIKQNKSYNFEGNTQTSSNKNTHLSTDADELLNQMHSSVFDNPHEVQKRIQMNKYLNHNLKTALTIHENIQESFQPEDEDQEKVKFILQQM